ncbi:CVNH domain-containing protein [Mycena kentingensis (nom. inval.)]|nr:CVNH domain-containing protein [Mycena kentingensis (nom. inval.)]
MFTAQLALLLAAAVAVSGSAINLNTETLLARSGAGNTCFSWSLSGSTVSARCTSNSGNTVSTSISLDRCLVNQNGKIACGTNGNAAQSCLRFFRFFQNDGGVFISAECNTQTSGGTDETVDFNLDACMTNSNGQLTC